MTEDIVVNNDLSICGKELSVSHAKSGGPGGQNVNKLNTKVFLRWDMSQNSHLSEEMRDRIIKKCTTYLTGKGEILVQSTRYRSQEENLKDCIEKLRNILQKALKPEKRRRKVKKSAHAKEEQLQEKKRCSEKKKRRMRIWNEDSGWSYLFWWACHKPLGKFWPSAKNYAA